ncbi:MAG: condensation domain-containing protein, partial [Pyrinomonadaceae bacterium]
SGALDVQALRQTLAEMLGRHESLRTTFTMMDGSPVQVVTPTVHVELPVIDLGHLPESEREAEALRLATEEAQRAFDLERGPLMRTSLVKLGAEDHVLLLNVHHIVSDAWSMG